MKKYTAILLVFSFLSTCVMPMAKADDLLLPPAGQRLALSTAFMPVTLKGVVVDPKDPFKFNFLVDSGDTGLKAQQLNAQGMKLIKYFLAALTVPEEDMWVNLSPYEKDRIIAPSFGNTDMGRDLLAQDYILKQLSASLTFPEDALGKKFWDEVYKKAQDIYGAMNIPLDTFNKVWIMPDKAQVYEHNNGAFVVESRLKVMLEEDYLATQKNKVISTNKNAEVIRNVILPELEKEVNEGQHFAALRQAYHAMILASWYKIRLKESILGKLYVNQNKINGVAINDKQASQKIYTQYLEAFKKGVYNYIKETPTTEGKAIPKKYFSGGLVMKTNDLVAESLKNQNSAMIVHTNGYLTSITVNARPMKSNEVTHVWERFENGDEISLKEIDGITEMNKASLREQIMVSKLSKKDLIIGALEKVELNSDVKIFVLETVNGLEAFMLIFKASPYRWSYVVASKDDKPAAKDILKIALKQTDLKIRTKDAAMIDDLKPLHKRPIEKRRNRLIDLPISMEEERLPLEMDGLNENVNTLRDVQMDDLARRRVINAIIPAMNHRIEEILGSRLSYPKQYIMASAKYRPRNTFVITVGNNPTVLDDIKNKGTSAEDLYILIKKRLNNKRLTAFFGGMVIIEEPSQKDLIEASQLKFLHENWEIKFTVGFTDSAMQSEGDSYGGIDLNARNLNLQIKRDGKGFVLPVADQDLGLMRIDGLFPVILNISAIPNLNDYLN